MKTERNVYLKMKPLAEARALLLEKFPAPDAFPAETVSAPDAVGRTLAAPVTARLSSPNFHAAAMDGVAVKAETTFGAGETTPKILEIGKDAAWINTGHVLPSGADAVIMIEHLNILDDKRLEIIAPAFPWQHVRKMGEDIVATELLFPRNHQVTPYCVGALLSGGVFSVAVKKKPEVMIIPTGTELVDWRTLDPDDLKPGQVIESNSYVLGKLTEACGGVYVKHDRVMDDLGRITQIASDAAAGSADVILILGGSSAGSEDYSRAVIDALGEVFIHGVTMMPGKPVVAGRIGNKPVFGIPGYPVSAIVAFEQLVRPLICRMLGRPEPERETVAATPARKIPSKLGVEEFLRVKLGIIDDRIVAAPLPRGAGCITSITEADGIIRIPNHVEGLKENEPVRVELLRPLSAVKNTLIAAGSHDNTLDVIADLLRARHGQLSLSSSHVGSMGGLMAVKRGMCHLAGSHLLDAEDGSYNLSYIRRFLPDTPVRVVNLVLRDQGLMTLPGNPKNIRGIEDLCRPDVTFINRQAGSGTRILLDYRIGQLGLNPDAIAGYADEEYTHMSVAAAVLGNIADAGLGINAAARALKLDFIPVVTEQYDLIIPEPHFESDAVQKLLETIRSDAFRERVAALGGYHTEKTGEVIL